VSQHPHSKQLLPDIQSKSTFFQLRTVAHVLSLQALVKRLSVFLTSPLYILKGRNKLSPEPSLLQAEEPQLSQPFFTGEVLQPSDCFHGPSLELLQQVHVFLVLGVLEPVKILSLLPRDFQSQK